MFEHLSDYNCILVTGPQRSGTRIATQMIALDTGHTCLEEETFNVHDEQHFQALLSEHRVVVQCPTMCHTIHEYAGDGTLVVLLMRDTGDILASEQRIEWTNGPYHELMNYGMSSRQARSYRLRGGEIAPIKYAHWREHQRDLIEDYIELEYESLAGHPLWVPKKQRADFGVRQTCRVLAS